MIAIIDYDAGNLKSVEKALQFLGQECVITRAFHEIKKADKVILPGVGSFGDAMSQLKKFELDKVIHEVAAEQKPFWESVWDYSFCLKEVKSLMEWKGYICWMEKSFESRNRKD